MKNVSKRVMGFMMSAILAAGMLAGCGEIKNEEPKDAIGMMEQYAAALENAGSYRMDGTISMKSGVNGSINEDNGGAFNFNIPIDMKFDMAANSSGEKIHGNVTLDMDTFDMTKMFSEMAGEAPSDKQQKNRNQSFSFELYSEKDQDNITVYTKGSGQDGWQKSTQSTKDTSKESEYAEMITEFENIAKGFEVFKDAEFKNTEENYEVIAPISSIIENSKIKDSIEKEVEKSGASEMVGKNYFDINDMFNQLGESSIKFTFDKNTKLLKNVKIDDVNYKTSINGEEYMGMNLTVEFSMSIDINMTDYGKLNESEYTVPDNIKNSAS